MPKLWQRLKPLDADASRLSPLCQLILWHWGDHRYLWTRNQIATWFGNDPHFTSRRSASRAFQQLAVAGYVQAWRPRSAEKESP